MQFEAEFPDPIPPGKLGCLAPERNEALTPLPLQQFEKVRRPAGNDPIRIPAAVGRAWTPAHTDDLFNTQQSGQLNGHPGNLSSGFGNLWGRMKRVTTAIESFQLEGACGDAV